MSNVRLAVVVPTRNRPDLCTLAVNTVVRQEVPGVVTVVSENSGPGEAREAVRRALPDGVPMIEPVTELPMPEHWDWALAESELTVRPTHVVFLTDRMIFRQGGLKQLLKTVTAHPSELISYNHDRLDDWNPTRVRLHAHAGDGGLYLMDAARLLRLVASGEPYQWPLPRMLNCAVPVEVFAEMRALTGHVFASVSPDFYFGYRFLALRDSFLCLNQSLVAHHSSQRSNGNSLRTGVMSPDAHDFRARTEVAFWHTPFPDVDTLANAIFSEYAIVRDLTGSLRFPPLNRAAVRQVLLDDADKMIDTEASGRIRARLGESMGLAQSRALWRRVRVAALHPRMAIGSRLPYSKLPPAVQPLLQRALPGGLFYSFNEAISAATAPSRRCIPAFPPKGTVGRIGKGGR